jgi:uncharacterized protein YqeY
VFVYYSFYLSLDIESPINMPIEEKITNDLKAAMKAKDEMRLSCLRLLKTSIKHKQVEKGEELKDEDIEAIISSSIRKGKEAAQEFNKGSREDLAAKEEAEIKILYDYMPKQLDSVEIEKIIKEIITELSIDSPTDLGKVMKAAMVRLSGKAQGKEVNEIARRLLS